MFGEIVLTLWPVIGGVKSKTRHWASYSAASRGLSLQERSYHSGTLTERHLDRPLFHRPC
jgi:hypothetical protein